MPILEPTTDAEAFDILREEWPRYSAMATYYDFTAERYRGPQTCAVSLRMDDGFTYLDVLGVGAGVPDAVADALGRKGPS